MHPIEHLRYVARSGAAPDRVLVSESVSALGAFADRPQQLLVSIRRLIGRLPESPGLVVLGARMLGSVDPIDAAWRLVDAMEQDPTEGHADALAVDEAGGVEIIEALASGPGAAWCPPGSGASAERARAAGRNVVVVTPIGSRLSRLLWCGFLDRNDGVGVGAQVEVLALDLFDEIVGPDGPQPVAAWEPDCSDVAELASF